jgi:hypothetical protein
MSEAQAHAWAIRMQAAGWRKQADGSWKKKGAVTLTLPKVTVDGYRQRNHVPAPLFGAKEVSNG